MIKTNYEKGDNVKHRGHECIVLDTWYDPWKRKHGITIEPKEGYGFPVDLYIDQIRGDDDV